MEGSVNGAGREERGVQPFHSRSYAPALSARQSVRWPRSQSRAAARLRAAGSRQVAAVDSSHSRCSTSTAPSLHSQRPTAPRTVPHRTRLRLVDGEVSLVLAHHHHQHLPAAGQCSSTVQQYSAAVRCKEHSPISSLPRAFCKQTNPQAQGALPVPPQCAPTHTQPTPPLPHLGSSRKAGSKVPRTTAGASTRLATSLSRSPRVLSGTTPVGTNSMGDGGCKEGGGCKGERER